MAQLPDVFFYEAFEEEEEALKRYLDPQINAAFTWKTIQEHSASSSGERPPQQPPAPLISIRTQSTLPLPWATQLTGILTRSTGYDHLVRYRKRTQTDTRCGYLPLYCHRAVAEQAMLLWMALLRKLPLQIQSFATFNRDGLTGRECAHKTLLVVGVGNIGHEVVDIGKGLGMRVLGVDIVPTHKDVTYISLEEGLAQADIIVCAMNLTEENEGYFDYETLRQAKPNAIFVNVARGELSPLGDLLGLLEEGHLVGVGLDVYPDEGQMAVAMRGGTLSDDAPVQALAALAKRPDVVLTPHNAFNTQESVDRKAEHSAQQVRYFLTHGTFLWPVP
jgi:D-lactate dehydrogenase